METQDQAQIAALTRDDLLGDMFHAGTLGYYTQYIALSHIAGLQQGGHHTLAAGTGTIGYEPNVAYFFGMPRSIQAGGVVFDIPIITIHGTDDGDKDKQKQYTQQTGMLSSALEHAVPEQMFASQDPNDPAPDAISAVKALQKASAAGQRIYHLTQANRSTALPNIHFNQATMDEIDNALRVGKEVITHTDNVSVPGWSGAGYIILDPETGDGAYKIGGGANGGYFSPSEMLAFVLGVVLNTLVSPANAGTVGSTVGSGMNIFSVISYALDVRDVYKKCGLEAAINYSVMMALIITFTSTLGTVLASSFGPGIGTVIGFSIGFIIGLILSAYLKDQIMLYYKCAINHIINRVLAEEIINIFPVKKRRMYG